MPKWMLEPLAPIIVLVVLVVIVLGASQLRGCSYVRQEKAVDRAVSGDLQGQGQVTAADQVRVAQDAINDARRADDQDNAAARQDPSAQGELPASVRARIAGADKRLCAKAHCD